MVQYCSSYTFLIHGAPLHFNLTVKPWFCIYKDPHVNVGRVKEGQSPTLYHNYIFLFRFSLVFASELTWKIVADQFIHYLNGIYHKPEPDLSFTL